MTMPPFVRTRRGPLTKEYLLVGYSGFLALNAGFVNAAALLILAFPVGNLTATTTELGINAGKLSWNIADSWRYEGHVLAAILFGFFGGAIGAGALLASTQALSGRRHAAVLTAEALFLLLAAFGVEETMIRASIESIGVEKNVVQALFAATALGLQNALTSSFRGMAIRTTHFTGTITDLGLMLGRSRRHGVEKLKATILAVTLLLFLAGGAAGLLLGTRLGGYAFMVPATICVACAAANVVHRRLSMA